MLTILSLTDLRTELSSVHSARSEGRLDWDTYVAATDLLNNALVSVRDLGPIKASAATRKARIIAHLDAMAIIAEVTKRTAIHTPGGLLNRSATPDQVSHIARCNRTLARCQSVMVRLASI